MATKAVTTPNPDRNKLAERKSLDIAGFIRCKTLLFQKFPSRTDERPEYPPLYQRTSTKTPSLKITPRLFRSRGLIRADNREQSQ